MNTSSWIDFWTTNTSIWYIRNEWGVNMVWVWKKNDSTTDRSSVFYDFWDSWSPVIWEAGIQLHIE